MGEQPTPAPAVPPPGTRSPHLTKNPISVTGKKNNPFPIKHLLLPEGGVPSTCLLPCSRRIERPERSLAQCQIVQRTVATMTEPITTTKSASNELSDAQELGRYRLRNCHKITFASRIVFTYSGRVSEPAAIKRRYEALRGVLDERSRRLLVAAESLALGRGGISAVARATGVSRQVIARGRQELTEPAGPPPGRIRRRGGGRKRSVTKDPTLKSELERLVEPLTRGDPESPLRWTLKSVRKLAA